MGYHNKLQTDKATSLRMSHVKQRGGDTEKKLAKALWHRGLRYRLNYKKLPGSPDIAITKYHLAIFVDGELWHGENWEERKKTFKRNREYWISKIEDNIARDRRVDKELLDMGWQPIHFWGKQVKRECDKCVDTILEYINNR